MFIIEIMPLFAIQRSQKKILSFYYHENLPAGSLVEIPIRGKKTKGIVINSQSIKLLKVRLKKEMDFELKPILKVLNKNPDPTKDPLDIKTWFPDRKIVFEVKKEKREESSEKILATYMERLAERKALQQSSEQAVTKAKNYMQETAENYLKYIDWENDTFEEDMRLFWISASNYYKSHAHNNFVQILEWVKKKDCLNPKQVAKLFNKE